MANNLVLKIDRDGRATQQVHDNLGRTTAENWLAGNWLTPELQVETTAQGSGTNEVQRARLAGAVQGVSGEGRRQKANSDFRENSSELAMP